MSLIDRTLGTGYATAAGVRAVSGIPDNDVSDVELEAFVVKASQRLHGDVASRHYRQGAHTANTARTRFQTRFGFIADRDLNKSVTAADITVEFLKPDSASGALLTASTGVVTMEDAAQGTFTTATAMPDGYSCFVTYDSYGRPLDLDDAAEAVEWLAAHLAVQRMRGPGKISAADIGGVGMKDHGNRTQGFQAHRTKYLMEYRAALRRIRAGSAVAR